MKKVSRLWYRNPCALGTSNPLTTSVQGRLLYTKLPENLQCYLLSSLGRHGHALSAVSVMGTRAVREAKFLLSGKNILLTAVT
jgi:hypothetical protein